MRRASDSFFKYLAYSESVEHLSFFNVCSIVYPVFFVHSLLRLSRCPPLRHRPGQGSAHATRADGRHNVCRLPPDRRVRARVLDRRIGARVEESARLRLPALDLVGSLELYSSGAKSPGSMSMLNSVNKSQMMFFFPPRLQCGGRLLSVVDALKT